MSSKSHNQQIDREHEAGQSVIDILIVITMIGVVASFSAIRIGAARDGIRLSNSAQLMTAYLEKARLAAVRCHCSTTVQISNTGSYTVTAPIKSATTETLSLPLEPNVTFDGLTLPLTITFDWRGVTDQDYHLTMRNSQGTRRVDLSGAGDIKLDSVADYSYAPTIEASLPTDLSDGAADSYVTSFANNNTNTPAIVVNPKNHKKPKK